MLVFPFMLIKAAEDAGMSYPEDPENFSAEEYPHFQVFCFIQLCRPAEPDEHWHNAKVIAKIPEDKIKSVTLKELINLGLRHPAL